MGGIKENTELLIFGNHNLQNMNAALLVCKELGVSKKDFIEQISTFKGASKRLEIIKRNNFNPLVNTNKNIPYLVDQHLLDKENA